MPRCALGRPPRTSFDTVVAIRRVAVTSVLTGGTTGAGPCARRDPAFSPPHRPEKRESSNRQSLAGRWGGTLPRLLGTLDCGTRRVLFKGSRAQTLGCRKPRPVRLTLAGLLIPPPRGYTSAEADRPRSNLNRTLLPRFSPRPGKRREEPQRTRPRGLSLARPSYVAHATPGSVCEARDRCM